MAVTMREKARTINSLICLLHGLNGRFTKVELRNETCVSGRIVSVDDEMNISLTAVRFRNVSGQETRFEYFYIKGKNVRYIHIPDDIDVLKTIQSHIDMKREARLASTKRAPRRTIRSKEEKRAARREVIERKMLYTQQRLSEHLARLTGRNTGQQELSKEKTKGE